MQLFMHGNVSQAPPLTFKSRDRFIAFVDVLGMSTWLTRAEPESIASEVDAAIGPRNVGQSSSGLAMVNGQERTWGPLVGTTQFSDTVLAWTYDASWVSFWILCKTLRQVVGIAAVRNIGLRGAIAVGRMVCDTSRLRFVGQPLAEAYQWSERRCEYRGIGISITPNAVDHLKNKAETEPIPAMCSGELDAATFDRMSPPGGVLQWHGDLCFINHWLAPFTAGSAPEADGIRRISQIIDRPEFFPEDDENRTKVENAREQTVAFYRACLQARRAVAPQEMPEEFRKLLETGRQAELHEAIQRDAAARGRLERARRQEELTEMLRLDELRCEESGASR
jgi:hypothetical protein